jgi:hypothetical protein
MTGGIRGSLVVATGKSQRTAGATCPAALDHREMVLVSTRTSPATRSPLAYAARGAVGGIAGGAVFIGVTMWFAATMGNPATAPLKLISTILLGADALKSGDASVPLGIAIHTVLSIAFGVVLGLIASRLANDGAIAVAALGYGLVLYLVNFQLLGRTVLPQFQNPNQPFEVFAHLVFAAVVAPFLFRYDPPARRA